MTTIRHSLLCVGVFQIIKCPVIWHAVEEAGISDAELQYEQANSTSALIY